MRIRILPVLIAVSALAFGLRLGDIWHGFGGMAEAQDRPAASAELVADPFSKTQLAAAGEGGGTGESVGREDGGTLIQTAREGGATEDAGEMVLRDPLEMTDEEIELLQQLAVRRQELNRRADALDQRERVVRAAEKRLADQVAELEALKGEIEGLLGAYDKQQDRQLERLVRIYEKMKPDDAARIFEDLEMAVLLKVVDRMNERRTAPILAEMAPEKAQALTLELAAREELPVPRD